MRPKCKDCGMPLYWVRGAVWQCLDRKDCPNHQKQVTRRKSKKEG